MNLPCDGRSVEGVAKTPATCTCIVLVLLAASMTACTGRVAESEPARTALPAKAPRPLSPFIGCLRRVGAEAIDVSAQRDLSVSGGEAAIAFSTFDAYVGLATGPAEASRAAQRLDQDLLLLSQEGQAVVAGNVVFYYDASFVPSAAGRLISACARGSEREARSAMLRLAVALPQVEFAPSVARGFARACSARSTPAACARAYRRATRLYRFGQLMEMIHNPRGPKLAALLRMA